MSALDHMHTPKSDWLQLWLKVYWHCNKVTEMAVYVTWHCQPMNTTSGNSVSTLSHDQWILPNWKNRDGYITFSTNNLRHCQTFVSITIDQRCLHIANPFTSLRYDSSSSDFAPAGQHFAGTPLCSQQREMWFVQTWPPGLRWTIPELAFCACTPRPRPRWRKKRRKCQWCQWSWSLCLPCSLEMASRNRHGSGLECWWSRPLCYL